MVAATEKLAVNSTTMNAVGKIYVQINVGEKKLQDGTWEKIEFVRAKIQKSLEKKFPAAMVEARFGIYGFGSGSVNVDVTFEFIGNDYDEEYGFFNDMRRYIEKSALASVPFL